MGELFEEYGGAIVLVLVGLLIMAAFLAFVVKVAGI